MYSPLFEGKETGPIGGKAPSRPNLDEEENDDEMSISGEEDRSEREEDAVASGEDDLIGLNPVEVAKRIAREACFPILTSKSVIDKSP